MDTVHSFPVDLGSSKHETSDEVLRENWKNGGGWNRAACTNIQMFHYANKDKTYNLSTGQLLIIN